MTNIKRKKQRSYIVEYDPNDMGFKDAILINAENPILKTLEKESGLNRKELESTGISRIIEENGILTIRKVA